MRKYSFLQDECSYVSLRDVERAMITFQFFYDKCELFGCEIDRLNEKENTTKKVFFSWIFICISIIDCIL